MKARSAHKPEKVQILGEKVLVRSNIEKVLTEEGESYLYDETRYTKDEYIQLLISDNSKMWDVVDYLIKGEPNG